MKKINFLTTIILGVTGLVPWAYSQDALNQLSSTQTQTTPQQRTSDSASTSSTYYNDDSRAKAVVVPTNRGYRPAKLLAGEQNSKYTLGPADVISITVMRHPEVSGLYTLNSEGKIQFEFVGDQSLNGLTKEEAAQQLAKSLEAYIVHPDISVKIIEYNSKVVYVVGEVGTPGKIYMRGDTITIRDALLAAGLPQLTASTDNATMFTPADNGKVTPKKVNVYALLYKGDLRENYTMKPGDTIYLPPTLWAKIGRLLNPITQPVGSAAGSAAAVGAL
jgi:polysaccharide export outer membrane protein